MKKYTLFFILLFFSSTLNATLVAYYDFENNIDDSVNSYDLDVSGGGSEAYSSTAIRGSSSYSFNGNDNYLELANQGSFTNSDSGTISFWIKTSSNSDTSFFRMDNTENIELLSESDSLTAFYDSGTFLGSTKDEKDNPNIYDNNWHMVTETFNATDGSEKMYIDGLLVSLDTDESNKFGLGSELYIGGESGSSGYYGYGGSSGTQYDGVMDDLRIYNNELNATEVYELFNPPTTTPTPTISVPISQKAYIFLILLLLVIGIKQTKA